MADIVDKTIGLLPAAPQILDESKFPIEQQGEAMYGTGRQLREFSQASVSGYVESAKSAAESANKFAQEAANSLSRIGTAVEDAEAARDAAQEAQTGAEAAMETVWQATEAADAAAERAATSEQNAQESAEAAAAFLASAEAAAGNAAKSEQNAAASQQAAEAAQKAAEAAQATAESASTAATEKAAEAADSAKKAEQYSGKPPIIQDGNWWTWNADAQKYIDTGKRAVLNFDVVYTSYEAMEADKENHPSLTTAIISSNVSDPHNAEIYIHNGADWRFLADLSGFTGVGIENIEQTGGNHAPGTTDTYTVTTTDGKEYTITVYNGRDGEGAGDVQGVPFTITLPAAGWIDGAQSINDSRFLASGRYSYIIGGASPKENRDEYNECNVQADGIPSDGSMTFYCDSDPDNDLTVIVQRLENPGGGDTARIFNCGGGGGGGGFPLDHLTILTSPKKTEYKSGELFDPDGMTVEVTYGNGLSVEVTNFTWSPLELTDGVENVAVTYSEGRKYVSAFQPVTVIPVLSSISVTKNPSKMDYVYLDSFQKDGMEVTAYYSDGSGHTVEWYTVQEPTFNRTGEFTIQVSYSEDDITRTAVLTVNVGRASIAETPSPKGPVAHTGEDVSPSWNDYDPAQLEISGETSASEIGPHTVTFTPKEYWQWADGTITGREVQWEIANTTIVVPVPYVSGSMTYTGGPQKPVFVDLDREHVDVSGSEEGADAGDYDTTFTLRENCVWATGGTDPVTVRWNIGRAIIESVPTQTGNPVYTGDTIIPTWDTYDPAKMDWTGDKDGVDAGDYEAGFTPNKNWKWADGGTDTRATPWKIGRATISATPTQSGNPVYTGQTIKAAFNNYNESELTIGGVTEAINAGKYKANFTPSPNHQWQGGGTETREVEWSIGKATGTLSTTTTTVTLDNDHTSVNVTVNTNSDGKITATSQNTSVATTSVSGKTVTVSAVESSGGSTLGDMAVGDTVSLNVDGKATDFIIVQQGNPDASMYDESCDGTWLLMKDCYEQRRQWNSSDVNDYENSTINAYLNNEFINKFDYKVKNAIKQVKIPYRPGSSGATVYSGAKGLSTKIFLLSGYEVGFTTSVNQYFPVDGAKLDYFVSGDDTAAKNKRISYLNGIAANWALRSAHTDYNSDSWYVEENGTYDSYPSSYLYGVRFCIILPKTFNPNPSYNSGSTTVTISVDEGTNWTKPSDVSIGVNAEFAPTGKALGDYAEGDIVKINEGGKPVEFYVFKQNYEIGLNGTGRVGIVRKDCYDKRQWHSSNDNAYAISDIDAWLNGDYKKLLDPKVQAAIGTTKFYYTIGKGNKTVSILERPVFILSMTELGLSWDDANVEGSPSPIASILKIAHFNGSNVNQWTRTPLATHAGGAWFSDAAYGGVPNYDSCSGTQWVRPAYTLPDTALFDPDTNEFIGIDALSFEKAQRVLKVAHLSSDLMEQEKVIAKQDAYIDYLSMMTGIDLPNENEQPVLDEDGETDE